MPFYRRRYGFRRRFRRRYGSRNIFKTKLRRQIRQSDSNRVIINGQPSLISLKVSNLISPDNMKTMLATGVVIVDPLLMLLGDKTNKVTRDQTFNAFANLYDQFKVNAMRVKLNIFNINCAAKAENAPTYFRSAVDLNGFDANMNTKQFWVDIFGTTPELPTSEQRTWANFLNSYGSFTQQQINVAAIYPFYRTFYPKGTDRYCWYGCSQKLEDATHNPNLDFKFKPCIMCQFLLAPKSTTDSGTQTTGTIDVQFEFDFDVTFKGQRRTSA